jgi:hypothetical protein
VDRITKALLSEFVEQNGLDLLPENNAFEHFSGFLVTSDHYSESFSSEDIAVGGGGDTGIDCIAVLVNGTIVTEPEEIADLADTNGYLDVSFVFTQAERSSSFETAKIGQFVFGVSDFFSETPQLPQNDRVQLYSRITRKYLIRAAFSRRAILNASCTM